MEISQKHQQFLFVPPQNRFNLRRFLWIRYEYLSFVPHKSNLNEFTDPGHKSSREREMTYFENVKSFKLNILTTIFQQVHHDFQILFVRDVPSHDFEICPI